MLETLVSSRVRRTLFEYILTHPHDRFYLRGLAKELGLSVSPLRRELMRLERSGMVKAVQEGNMRFYVVDISSPQFLQLQRASQQTEAPSAASVTAPETLGSRLTGDAPALAPQTYRTHTTPVGLMAGAGRQPFPSLSQPGLPLLIGATGVWIALMLVLAALFYFGMTNRTAMSQASRGLTTRNPEVTVVVPHSSSGAMRSSRWQIVPGGFGGFSSGANEQSY